jgi:M6 family metalloprotease-like protein
LLGLLLLAVALPQPVHAAIVKDRTCAVTGSGDVTTNTDPRFFVSSKGEVKTAMLFVDFPDVQAGALSTQSVYDLFVPRSQRWYQEVSYGRASLSVAPHHGWLRMPRPAAEYFPRGAEVDYQRYIADALNAADPAVDFSGVELVYIVPAPGSGHELGPAHFSPDMVLDGQELRNFVTFGDDTMLSDPATETHSELLVHETGHELSLPDYYSYTGEDIHRNLGSWDPMGEAFLGNHFSAWSKRKLGWLGKSEFLCVSSGSSTVELRALDAPTGRRGVFIRVSSTRAFIVEARRRRGFDAPICAEGVVVYLLDGRRDGATGGLTVRRRLPDSGEAGSCGESTGRFDRAPFVPGTTFRWGKVSVAVLSTTANGYRIRVSKRR